MPTYEAMFVNRSEALPEKIKETTEKIQKLITQDDGEIILSENWGKRRLTFEIKGCHDGNFSRIVFSAKPGLIKALNRSLQVDDDIIRHIIVRASNPAVQVVKPKEEKEDNLTPSEEKIEDISEKEA